MNNLHKITSHLTDLEKACLWWYNDRFWDENENDKSFLRKEKGKLIIHDGRRKYSLVNDWGNMPDIDPSTVITYQTSWHVVYHDWIANGKPEPTIR
jgi:hypothetical protein